MSVYGNQKDEDKDLPFLETVQLLRYKNVRDQYYPLVYVNALSFLKKRVKKIIHMNTRTFKKRR